jgi:two-component system, NarL family, response regulator LiaR
MAVRILIVDDSAIFRQGLRTMLEEQIDWEVCGEAADGFEAVQKNRDLTPDVIIVDLSMPRMSGVEAARQILAEFPKVPIFMLTLYLTRQLAEDASKVGIRATLSKTAPSQLVSMVRVLLDERGSSAQAH